MVSCRERKRCPAARAALLLELFDRRCGAHPNPPGSSVDWGADSLAHPNEQPAAASRARTMAAPAQAEAAVDHSDPGAIYLSYLDKLRGETSTRPIWAISRGLVGVVDEHSGNYEMVRTFVALAATCRRARDLCTPGLRAYMVYGMARALARGGAFLKGKRAYTLVASLIKHTTHSFATTHLRLGVVPLVICDETVEVLLPLLRCTDWIDFDIAEYYWFFQVFTNYPSFSYEDDKLDGRLQVRDVAALLLCARCCPCINQMSRRNTVDLRTGRCAFPTTSGQGSTMTIVGTLARAAGARMAASRTSNTSRSNMSGHFSTSSRTRVGRPRGWSTSSCATYRNR